MCIYAVNQDQSLTKNKATWKCSNTISINQSSLYLKRYPGGTNFKVFLVLLNKNECQGDFLCHELSVLRDNKCLQFVPEDEWRTLYAQQHGIHPCDPQPISYQEVEP